MRIHVPLSIALIFSPIPLIASGMWKVKWANTPSSGRNKSVHGNMTDRGVEIVGDLDPLNRAVWDGVKDTLWTYSGTLTNDGNSHGNRILFSERGGDMGDPTPEDEKTTDFLGDALTYNGGPFFRYWTRMLEAHNRMDPKVPPGKRRFPVTGPGTLDTGQPAQNSEDIYKYLGHMVHLVEDNCSPTHAANIRHGFNDCIEWYHWETASALGGAGRSMPKDAGYLEGWIRTLSLGENINFKTYFDVNNSISRDARQPDRGLKNAGSTRPHDKRNDHRLQFDQLIEKVITNTQRWMINVDGYLKPNSPTRYAEYINSLKSLTEGGKRPSETEIQSIVLYNDVNRVFGDRYPLDPAQYPASRTIGASARPGADLLMTLLHQRPAFKVWPSPSKNLIDMTAISAKVFEEGFLIPDKDHAWGNPKLDHVKGGEWNDFNAMTTPWLPNPYYKGGAFDSNWGSYGGRWGFPGRAGASNIGQASYDAISLESNEITPGDLYLMHTEQPNYLPYHPFRDVGYVGTDYYDERKKDKVAPIGDLSWLIGETQIDRGAMWAGILLKKVSEVLPPVFQDLEVHPRNEQPGNPISESQGHKLAASSRGAVIDLSLVFQRTDDYLVEFYAIPRELMADTTRWKRALTLGNRVTGGRLGSPSVLLNELWPSDLSLDDGNPVNPGSDPRGYLVRKYDYVYSKLPLFPLRVQASPSAGASIPEVEFNLRTPSRPSDFDPKPLVVTPVAGAAGTDYRFASKMTFVWNGEVGIPRYLFDSQMSPTDQEKSGKYLETIENKKLLTQGGYFFFIVAYRKNTKWAFANNQFKLKQGFKNLVETYEWWSPSGLKWRSIPIPTFEPAGFAGWYGTQVRPENAVMIPDELYLVRIDSKSILVHQ